MHLKLLVSSAKAATWLDLNESGRELAHRRNNMGPNIDPEGLQCHCKRLRVHSECCYPLHTIVLRGRTQTRLEASRQNRSHAACWVVCNDSLCQRPSTNQGRWHQPGPRCGVGSRWSRIPPPNASSTTTLLWNRLVSYWSDGTHGLWLNWTRSLPSPWKPGIVTRLARSSRRVLCCPSWIQELHRSLSSPRERSLVWETCWIVSIRVEQSHVLSPLES